MVVDSMRIATTNIYVNSGYSLYYKSPEEYVLHWLSGGGRANRHLPGKMAQARGKRGVNFGTFLHIRLNVIRLDKMPDNAPDSVGACG